MEASYIVDQIFSKRLKGEPYSSFAVLARNSSLLRNIEHHMRHAGIPYRMYGGYLIFGEKKSKILSRILNLRLIIMTYIVSAASLTPRTFARRRYRK